jgi:hypothetical protein
MDEVPYPPLLGVVAAQLNASPSSRERRLYRCFTAGLSDAQCRALDGVLELREGNKQSLLTWLRQPPGAANPRNLLAYIERLRALRAIGLPLALGRDVHQNHLFSEVITMEIVGE